MGDNKEYFNINQKIGNFLEKTLWIWMPFCALVRLTKDVIAKHDHNKK
jgi:hypothetical protein